MTYCLRLFFPVLLCFGLVAGRAQGPIGFSLPLVNNASIGQILNMPVRVQNFDSIISIQYVIRWDSAVVQFQEVNGFNLPSLDISNFSVTEVSKGILRLVWWYVDGATRPDNAAIFNLKMKVIGPLNSSSPVYFTEITPTTFFEVINVGNDAFGLNDALIDDGFVAVGFTVGTGEAGPTQAFSAWVAPNPVSPDSRVWIEAARAQDAVCTLTDPAGRNIFTKKISLSPGKNGMEIASYLSGRQGMWYLSIRTPFGAQVIPLLSF